MGRLRFRDCTHSWQGSYLRRHSYGKIGGRAELAGHCCRSGTLGSTLTKMKLDRQTHRCTCRGGSLLVLALALSAMAADPSYYIKKDTWQDTLFASREALLAYEAEQARQAAQAKPDAARPMALHLGTWYVIGPLYPPGKKKDFGYAFPPEKEPGLSETDEAVLEIEGISHEEALAKRYGKLRWQPKPDFRDGVVHNLRAGPHGSTYLYRTITAHEDSTITGYFGSDDGMRAWLNGELIISKDVPRGVGPNQETAKLELNEGLNHLLLKIHNNSGGHGFYFHTSPNPVGSAPDPKQIARDGLWSLVARDFQDRRVTREMSWEREDGIWAEDWKRGDVVSLGKRYVGATEVATLAKEAAGRLAEVETAPGLVKVREPYYRAHRIKEASAIVRNYNFQALRLAVADLSQSYPEKYMKGATYLEQIDALEKKAASVATAISEGGDVPAGDLASLGDELHELRVEALLANPLLDFDKLLLAKRGAKRLGLPQNWQGNCAVPRAGYDNELAVLSPVSPQGAVKTLYKPGKGEFVGDVDLHFSADRMLFSSVGTHGRWQIFEMNADGTGLRQVTPGEHPDVDNYDACYLPDGNIVFASTRCFQGIPCVTGGNTVANLCLLEPATGKIRQLCFDQDHNWCPTVLNNGRVLYSRWEYSDTPHYFTRLLFHMNPDGSEQMEYYGSNSYWPNSIFYARPIPSHSTKVVAIVSGHHGVPRMGELVVFDPGAGRHEAGGAVQRIPGYGKRVPPTIADALVNSSWPKFLHPYPLSDKYFLVSCQPNPKSSWGLYLVDVFDNMLLLQEAPGYALLEPIPLRKSPTPPTIPSKVNTSKTDAVVYLHDVYAGRGLHGVPRGTVKNLRIFEFHYAYPRMGGHINIGIDGPWDVHRIVGTVPVYKDGSALFRAPANTPLAVQPLDAEGKALQVMRSWYTAMPGEFATCVGCHEPQNRTPAARRAIAATRAPSKIEPWRGAARGFSFPREVQPVLDRHCAGCHSGLKRADGKQLPNFADTSRGHRNFTKSYLALHPYVRRPGPESDYHVQKPLEWHADTSELVQMLKKGHHNVKLDAEAWDRLVTWIDLNVPDHGTWGEHRKIAGNFHERRLLMRTKYANRPEDPEKYPTPPPERLAFVKPEPGPERQPQKLDVAGWPFGADEAKERQASAAFPAELKIDLGDGNLLYLVLVPKGEFVMGSCDGYPDEYPQAQVKIERPFYMGKFEITNAQYAPFDPTHDSRYISVFNKDQSTPGQVANRAQQPVIRISWQQAMAFCEWLSGKTGRKFTLPTEAQWEYACRAGAATPMHYGDVAGDFAKFANLADQRLRSLCRRDSPKWIPCLANVDDGAVVTSDVGRYQPNAWGLYDMHGNVAEWTLTTYKPYPYDPSDGRDDGSPAGRKVTRGGSFYDRPKRGRSAFRLDYYSWQPVFNVGFRVVCEPSQKLSSAAPIGR